MAIKVPYLQDGSSWDDHVYVNNEVISVKYQQLIEVTMKCADKLLMEKKKVNISFAQTLSLVIVAILWTISWRSFYMNLHFVFGFSSFLQYPNIFS